AAIIRSQGRLAAAAPSRQPWRRERALGPVVLNGLLIKQLSLLAGVEPATHDLRSHCSTSELQVALIRLAFPMPFTERAWPIQARTPPAADGRRLSAASRFNRPPRWSCFFVETQTKTAPEAFASG